MNLSVRSCYILHLGPNILLSTHFSNTIYHYSRQQFHVLAKQQKKLRFHEFKPNILDRTREEIRIELNVSRLLNRQRKELLLITVICCLLFVIRPITFIQRKPIVTSKMIVSKIFRPNGLTVLYVACACKQNIAI